MQKVQQLKLILILTNWDDFLTSGTSSADFLLGANELSNCNSICICCDVWEVYLPALKVMPVGLSCMRTLINFCCER